MRRLRILIVLFFVAACAIYGVHTVRGKMTADNNAPVISMESNLLEVGQGATDEDLLVGVTAMDAESGDISDRIQVASISKFQNDGTRVIKYIVFDEAEKVGQAERTLIYKDYVSPRIYIKQPLRFDVEDYYKEMEKLQITAEDYIDGDISNKVRMSFENDNFKVGEEYPITFQVNNSAGDTCLVTLKFQVLDNAKEGGKFYPLLSDYVIYIKQGKRVDASSYLQGISNGTQTYIFGEEGTPWNIDENQVEIDSNVDYNKPGVYTVEYTYTTRENVSATSVLYVVVEE